MNTFTNALTIIRETDKAVAVSLLRNNAWLVEDYMDNTVTVWFPKSQIQIENGQVIGASDWIIKSKIAENNQMTLNYSNSWKGFEESELETIESQEQKEKALNAGIERYELLVSKAKAAGLPVRNRMKTSTILKIAAQHGITL